MLGLHVTPDPDPFPLSRLPPWTHHRHAWIGAVASCLAPASAPVLLLSLSLQQPGDPVRQRPRVELSLPALLHSERCSCLTWAQSMMTLAQASQFPAPPPAHPSSLSSDPRAPSWTLSTFLPMALVLPFPPGGASSPQLFSFTSLRSLLQCHLL